MRKQWNLDIAKEAIQSAFLPFQCSFESIADTSRLQFHVVDDEGRLLLTVEADKRRICDARRGFKTIVSTARAKLEQKGLHLTPWDADSSMRLLDNEDA